MSNAENTGARDVSTAKFKAVGGGPKGELRFVRASELNKAGTTGVVALGTYEGAVPNNMEPTRLDYKVREANGTLVIINGAGNLGSRMAQATDELGLSIGQGIQITYNGMSEATKGKLKGKKLHNFSVEIEDTEA